MFTFTITEVILLFPFFLQLRNKHDGNLYHFKWYHQVKQMAMSSTKHKITRHYFNFYAPNNSENALVCLVQFASVDTLNYHKEQFNKCFLCLYRNYTNRYSIIDSSLTNGRNQHSCGMIIQCGLETKTKNKRFRRSASCFISLLENSVYCKRRRNSLTLPDVISLVLT